MTTNLKIIYMGTADFAVPSLKALLADSKCSVTAVVTQPDRPKGRDLKLQPSPVKKIALEAGLPVLQPERARDPIFIEQLGTLGSDLMVVAAYGQILPPAILDLPRFGCINVHSSLLPKYRGAAPIQWAMLNGETETGVTIMKMAAGLDTGDILRMTTTPILTEDTGQSLHDRLAVMGAELLGPTISDFVAGKITPRAQMEAEATYARKIAKEDGRLDWSLSARMLWNRVRTFTPWPGAFTFHQEEAKPRLIKIWSVAVEEDLAGKPGEIICADKSGIIVGCGQGALRILELQREGGKRLAAGDFLAGHRLSAGERLGG